MQVGSPSQNFRLLPGTSASTGTSIWVVRPEGCITTDPKNCGDLRGFLFNSNDSSTWSTGGLKNNGLYDLTAFEENILGYSGNAYYGFDDITFGWQSDRLPKLSHQVIAGYVTKDFYLGSLGISPQPILFDNFNNAYPSLLTTLRNESLIPSFSWSYTAGAYYQEPKVYGSLILGGYDTTRHVPNNVSITFGADSSRDLLVGIQQITSDTFNTPLLSSGIYAFVDSLVSHIWLPLSACSVFEQAFNLTWNDTAELYLLTKDEHAKLTTLNPNITIRLGPDAAGGNKSVDILMPYGAFDLIASSPLVESPTHYFPIKRAQNETQYTLGRVFLQQAYIIADYDRSNFSISQALFPPTSTPSNIVPILPPGVVLNTKHTLVSKKGIIAISSSIVPFMLLVIILFYSFKRLRRRPVKSPKELGFDDRTPEILPFEKPELDHSSVQVVQLDTAPLAELASTERIELSSGWTGRHGDDWQGQQLVNSPNFIHKREELPDSVLVGSEMPAEPIRSTTE